MTPRLREAWETLKRSKLAKGGIVALVVLVAALLLGRASTRSHRPTGGAVTRPAARSQPSAIQTDLPAAAELRSVGLSLEDDAHRRDERLATMEAEVAHSREALDRIEARLAELQRTPGGQAVPPAPEAFLLPPGLRTDRPGSAGADDGTPGNRRVIFIPAGSYGNVTLLTGVYAPTSGESLPVVMRLNEVLTGPNRARVPVQGALLVGRATGDPNTSRVMIQATTLAYVDPDGRGHERSISGFVAGEDGYLGVEGTYVWRIADTLFPAMAAAGLSEAGRVLVATQQQVTVGPLGQTSTQWTGDKWQAAGFAALGRSTDILAQTMARRAAETLPAVVVPNGCRATVLLQTGVEIPVDPAALEQVGATPYADLDGPLHR